jgi:hypothetical protein
MVLSVFGDESADETKQRVFAVSGLFGLESEWQAVEDAWTDLTKGEVFHAADWEYAKRRDEYKALTQVLASGQVGGVVYAVDLVAFQQVFPGTMRESAYMKGFTRVVIDIASNAERFNASQLEPPFTKIEYTFDNRPETEFSAARAYGSFMNEPDWTAASLLADKVSFQCRTNPRIQMADLVAREGMKDLDRRVGPVAFSERQSKIALESSGRFKFFGLGREHFEAERSQHSHLEKDGVSEEAYHRWLLKKRAQDTWDNKVRFLEYVDAKSRSR